MKIGRHLIRDMSVIRCDSIGWDVYVKDKEKDLMDKAKDMEDKDMIR